MKEKELKTIWKLARSFWITGTLVWILETAIFLIIEGWHLRATNPVEIWLDKAVSGMWTFALWLTICVCVYYVMNLTKRER